MSDAAAPPDLSRAALGRYIQEHIQPLCETFERDRAAAAASTSARKGVALVFVAFGIVLMVFAFSLGRPGLGAIVCAIVAAGLWLWIALPGHDWQQSIQSRVWPVVFAFYGPDFRFQRQSGGSNNSILLRNCGLLPADARWTFGDRVTGTYRGVPLAFEELVVWSGEKDQKDCKRLFKGIVLVLHMRLDLGGRTLVLKDQGVGNLVRRWRHELPRVRLEDPVFERIFEVFSHDQLEARMALTPAVMNRLANLAQRHRGRIQCTFHPGGFIAFIDTERDYFAVRSSLDQMVTFHRDVLGIHEEMQGLLAIVDELKLHRKVQA